MDGSRATGNSDGDVIEVFGVMMSQGEVMVIVVVTAIIVFIIARKRKVNK